jgi:acetyltransferase-like isoleucine patch superfamily enzyme
MINLKNILLRRWRKYNPAYQELFQAYLIERGVNLGRGCRIFSDISTNESFLITLKDNVTISNYVQLLTHDNSISKLFPGRFSDYFGRITIGNNCFIGAKSIIMPGVTLGDNTIVGAGSIVTKSFPEGVVLAGVPARVLCKIDEYATRVEKYGINIHGLTDEERKGLLLNSDRLIVK